MNKLLFSEGGQPIYLDDLNFMQNAFAETVKGIVSTYGNVILSGCKVTFNESASRYEWTEGYIVINGEVYKVEAGSLAGSEDTVLYWKTVSTEGQKEIFENSSEHNIYQYRKVTLTDTVTATDVYVAVKDMKSVEKLTSMVRIFEVKEVSVEADKKKGTIQMYEEDAALLEDGDIVELLVSMGLESGMMGGASMSIESFKYQGKGVQSAAKAFVWRKIDLQPSTVVCMYVNFNREKGAFYVVNEGDGNLSFGPRSEHRVIVYKDINKG